MTTTTLNRTSVSHWVGGSIALSLNKAMTYLVSSLNALDKTLRQRPTSVAKQAAALLRLADAYESTQPSYAADLRAAASTVGDTTAR